MYMVSVIGASGADVPHTFLKKNNPGGHGAEAIGIVKLRWGQQIWFMVGQKGDWADAGFDNFENKCRSGAGGGASVCAVMYDSGENGGTAPILKPLLVGGGGGGRSRSHARCLCMPPTIPE